MPFPKILTFKGIIANIFFGGIAKERYEFLL